MPDVTAFYAIYFFLSINKEWKSIAVIFCHFKTNFYMLMILSYWIFVSFLFPFLAGTKSIYHFQEKLQASHIFISFRLFSNKSFLRAPCWFYEYILVEYVCFMFIVEHIFIHSFLPSFTLYQQYIHKNICVYINIYTLDNPHTQQIMSKIFILAYNDIVSETNIVIIIIIMK